MDKFDLLNKNDFNLNDEDAAVLARANDFLNESYQFYEGRTFTQFLYDSARQFIPRPDERLIDTAKRMHEQYGIAQSVVKLVIANLMLDYSAFEGGVTMIFERSINSKADSLDNNSFIVTESKSIVSGNKSPELSRIINAFKKIEKKNYDVALEVISELSEAFENGKYDNIIHANIGDISIGQPKTDSSEETSTGSVGATEFDNNYEITSEHVLNNIAMRRNWYRELSQGFEVIIYMLENREELQ